MQKYGLFQKKFKLQSIQYGRPFPMTKKMNGDKESQLARMIPPIPSCQTIYHQVQSTSLFNIELRKWESMSEKI